MEGRVLLAADGDFGFAFSFDDASTGQGTAVATDSTGNVFVAGNFIGTVDLDPGSGVTELTSTAGSGLPNSFIAKYTSNGSLVWALPLTGNATQVLGLALDGDDNLYATGLFQNTVDFDPGIGTQNRTSQGLLDIFVLKLNSAGDFDFVTTTGGSGNDFALGIAVDADHNIYTAGAFSQTVDFDAGPGVQNRTSQGGYDIFVSKLNSSGQFDFASTIGGPSDDAVLTIAVDSAGNVYTTGGLQGTIDFDPGVGVENRTSQGGGDAFVYKLDNDGNFGYVLTVGGSGDDVGLALALDSSDNIYYTGYFTGTVDLDPGAGVDERTSVGSFDGFVSKLDANGNLVYASVLAGPSFDTPASIVVDVQGDVYSTGTFATAIDLDPGPGVEERTSNGGRDIYVSKLDANGNFVYGASLGGPSSESVADIAVDRHGNAYTTGYFIDTADFDPGPDTFNLVGVLSLNFFLSQLQGPTVDLSVTSTSGTEAGQTQITVTATLDSAAIGDHTVDLLVTGTGITSGDYALTDDDAGLTGIQIKILDDQTTGTVTFTVLNDNLVELPETATLKLANPSSGIRLGSTITQDVTITDNDAAVISISNPTAVEGGTLSFDVTISNPVDVAVTADRATSDGTATAGSSDYTPVASSNVQLFGAGSTSTFSVTINTTADGSVEPDETINLILSSLAAGGRNVTFNGGGPNLTVTGTLTNDDTAPTLGITPDGTLTSAATVTFTFQFSHPMTGFEVADINLTNGVAGTFTVVDADTYTLEVTPIADGIVTVAVDAGQATDSGSNPNPATTATVTSDRTGPVFSTSTSFEVAENTSGVETAAATDLHGPVAYSLVVGGDAARFVIDPLTGILAFASAPDFEVPADSNSDNIYILQIKATDPLGTSTTQALTVTVTAVNDNIPVFTSGAAFQIAENTTTAGTVSATDADLPVQTLTYNIAGGADGNLFSISNAGVLTFKSAPDFEAPADTDANNVYEVDVTVGDGHGSTKNQSLTVTVTDALEVPQLTNISVVTWTKVRPPTPIKVLPTVDVTSPGSLVGGTLSIIMNTVGSKRKSADLLRNPAVSSIGTGSDFVYANGKLTLQIDLGEQATAAKVQSFLQGITFFTKGKGLKTLTRTLQVTLTDAADHSALVSQTIHVRKKP